MITRNDLTNETKLRVKAEHNEMITDKELQVVFAGEATVILRTEAGTEMTTDYAALDQFYTVVPSIDATRDNFAERSFDSIERMIAHLTAFTQTSAVGADNNIIAIGSKLHEMKNELEGYLKEDGALKEPVSAADLLVKKHA
jgi:hypothetical protein